MSRLRTLWNILLKSQGFVTDNIVFRLHYKLTLSLLLVLSFIIAFRQQFGSSIKCTSRSIQQDLFNDYCYVHSTYSVVEAWKRKVGEEILYPGVSKYNPDDTRVYHYYYQWVSLVLLIQAVLFFVPRYFWNSMESGRIRDMVSELKTSSETPKTNFHSLAKQVNSDFNYNEGYFASYFFAEVLNVVNVIGQIFLMDAFLGGTFLSYGSQVLGNHTWNGEAEYNPMIRVFPRMTTCILHIYASSGDVQRHSAMCLLPINILNEKVYLFLWFWFIILATLSCLVVVYRLLILISPRFRRSILLLRTRPDAKQSLQIVLENRGVGDWFILYLLSKNLRPSYFRDLVLILDGEAEYVEPKFVESKVV